MSEQIPPGMNTIGAVDMVIDVAGGDGLADSVQAVKGSGMVTVFGLLDRHTKLGISPGTTAPPSIGENSAP